MPLLTRVLCFAVVLLFAMPAMGSFDMHLIPSAGQIRRYDPDTNLALGGISVPNTNNVTLDQANNRVFVSDTASDSIRAYNYNTGAAVGAWSIGAQVQQMAYHAGTNSIVFVNTAGGVGRLNIVDGSLQSLSLASGVTARTISVTAGAIVVGGLTATNALHHTSYEPFSGNVTDSFGLGGTLVLPGTTLGKALTVTNANGRLTSRYVFRNSAGALRVATLGLAADGFVTSSDFGIVLTGHSSALMPSVARGHNGFFVIGSDATLTNTLRVEEYSEGGVLLRQNTLGGYALNPLNFGADNVVAPEPGTLAAIAIGGAALLRRRKKRASTV